MKVYVVSEYEDFEGGEVCAVVSSAARAKTKVRRLEKANKSSTISYDWNEWDVEGVRVL